MDEKYDKFGIFDVYHVPRNCKQCGGVLVFKGVGEYHCEDCGFVDYDDYGKVRLYIENHKGANAVEVEQGTGVSQKSIRQMLKDSRLQVAETSQIFMHCEICDAPIRSGKLCPDCEMKVHRNMEEQQRKMRKSQGQGYGMSKGGDEGHRRFVRE